MSLVVGCDNSGHVRPLDYVYDTETDDEGKQAKEPVADTESDSDDATSKTQVKDANVAGAADDKNSIGNNGAKEPLSDTMPYSDNDDGKAEPQDAPTTVCVSIYPDQARRSSLRPTAMRTSSYSGNHPYRHARAYKRTQRA